MNNNNRKTYLRKFWFSLQDWLLNGRLSKEAEALHARHRASFLCEETRKTFTEALKSPDLNREEAQMVTLMWNNFVECLNEQAAGAVQLALSKKENEVIRLTITTQMDQLVAGKERIGDEEYLTRCIDLFNSIGGGEFLALKARGCVVPLPWKEFALDNEESYWRVTVEFPSTWLSVYEE